MRIGAIRKLLVAGLVPVLVLGLEAWIGEPLPAGYAEQLIAVFDPILVFLVPNDPEAAI